MPTIPEIKAELKALGVKGITGKNKAELVAMLEQAKAPKEAPKKKGPKIAPKKPEIGDVSEPPIIAPKRKPEIGDVSEPPKEAPKKKGPRIAPKKPEIGEDGLAELLGIIAKEVAGPAPAPATAPHETEEGEALQSFGHFIWRRFDSGDTKGMKKNIRRTAGGMFPMYAMDLVKVKDRFPSYWEEWNPIIGLMIPGASGKARATCNPDGTVSFTNIMLEEKEEASYSAINDAVVREYREYGTGDLQPRYKKIAEALTSMRVYNKGEKSQGEKKPSKEEVGDFVRSEIARTDQMTKARAEAPRLTPAERHERDRLELVKWREKVAEDSRKSHQEMLQRNAQNAKEEAERLLLMGIKKASPPPIIPWNIKEKMRYNLARDYDLHEYKIGLAHPIDDMIKWFRRLADRDNSVLASVAERFLSELTKWVRENSHERPSWGDQDKTERVLLLSDWEDFFKAN